MGISLRWASASVPLTHTQHLKTMAAQLHSVLLILPHVSGVVLDVPRVWLQFTSKDQIWKTSGDHVRQTTDPGAGWNNTVLPLHHLPHGSYHTATALLSTWESSNECQVPYWAIRWWQQGIYTRFYYHPVWINSHKTSVATINYCPWSTAISRYPNQRIITFHSSSSIHTTAKAFLSFKKELSRYMTHSVHI